MKEESNNRKSSRLRPLLIGSAVGAGIALLLAPKKGKEMRKDLKRFAAKTRDQVADVIEEGRDLYKEGRGVVAGAVKAVLAGKERYDEATDKIEKLMHKKERSLMAPILASGIIGAGVALLLAPQSGKKVRGTLKLIAANTRDKFVSAMEKGKVLYMKAGKAIPAAVIAGKKAYVRGIEKLRHAA